MEVEVEVEVQVEVQVEEEAGAAKGVKRGMQIMSRWGVGGAPAGLPVPLLQATACQAGKVRRRTYHAHRGGIKDTQSCGTWSHAHRSHEFAM